jgi:hypothetical protein
MDSKFGPYLVGPKSEMDLSNGYLVAEILSWYFPQEIEISRFLNVSSLKLKLANWTYLKKFMKQKHLPISDAYIDAVMHNKEGAAVLLLQALYQLLTNRQLKVITANPQIDFTDHSYQSQLPDHARATAVQAIRSNLKGSELQVITNIVTRRQLAQNIVNRHTENRSQARQQDPKRYGHRPTIGELAVRHPPPPEYSYSFNTEQTTTASTPWAVNNEEVDNDDPCEEFEPGCSTKSSAVRFHEVAGSDLIESAQC